MLKIDEVKKLPAGKILSTSGWILRVDKVQDRGGFYTQSALIKDDTGVITASFGVDETPKLKDSDKGKLMRITRGKKWGRSGSGGVNAYEFEVVEPKKKQTQKQDADKVPQEVWEEKDKRMARMSAIKAAVELIVADKIDLDEMFEKAEEIVDFIYNGNKEENGIVAEIRTDGKNE